jgi:hypothetical protein
MMPPLDRWSKFRRILVSANREIGHREEFHYKNRNFIMVIESIDYRRNSVTIRIKEI